MNMEVCHGSKKEAADFGGPPKNKYLPGWKRLENYFKESGLHQSTVRQIVSKKMGRNSIPFLPFPGIVDQPNLHQEQGI